MFRFHTCLPLAVLFAMLTAGAAEAETTLSYQGKLEDAGQPFDGSVDLRFKLFDAATAGQQIGSEILLNQVPVENGLFQVELDFGSSVFDTSPLWLAVRVDGVDLTPRQRLGAAPFAINAANGGIEQVLAGFGLIGGGSGDSISLSVDSTLFQRRVSGSCSPGSSIRTISSIGGVTCEADDAGALTLPFSGSASTSLSGEVLEITNTGSGNAIVGRSSYEGGQTWIPAIYGVHESPIGPGDGVQGTTETTFNGSAGVRGRALGTTGQVYGVYGFGRSPQGFAGYFRNTAGPGLWVESNFGPDVVFEGVGVMQADSGFSLRTPNPSAISSALQVYGQSSSETLMNVAGDGDLFISGSLTQNSDRYAKHAISPVDLDHLLERLRTVTVSTWRFNDDPDTLHMGPMAQDFHAAFGLGEDPTGISAIDADGVALAAIQGLLQKVGSQQQRIEALEAELARRERSMARRVARLELLLTGDSPGSFQEGSSATSP